MGAIIEQLEAGVYAVTPYLRLFQNDEWHGWKIGGSHQRLSFAQPEATDIRSPNRTNEGTYADDVVRFSIKTASAPYVLDFDNPSKDVLAISLAALAVEQVVAAGTGTEVTRSCPGADGYVFLGYDDVSSVVVNREDGENAPDWADTTYAAGDFVVPTAPNGHFYECTVAGDADATEPTWPTDGSTVVDGTVTWQDMGLIIAASGTDYTVSSAADGVIRVPAAGSSLVKGESLRCVFDNAAVIKTVYRKDQQIDAYGQFQFVGRNLAKDQSVRCYCLWCHIKATAEADYAQGDNLVVRTIEITPMTPNFEMAGLEKPDNWIGQDSQRIETIER